MSNKALRVQLSIVLPKISDIVPLEKKLRVATEIANAVLNI